MDTSRTQPAPTAEAVAARQANLLKAYGLSAGPTAAQLLETAHVRAQSLRFAAAPSFADMLQQAAQAFRSQRGGA